MDQVSLDLEEPFKAFTVRSDNLSNRIVSKAKVCGAYDPENPPVDLPEAREVDALWDTGATSTVISERITGELGLIPIGKIIMTHANGQDICDTFLVNIQLPSQLDLTGVTVTASKLSDIDMLIGMDIICMGDLALTNKGSRTCFSFRVPSKEEIDYTE